MVSLPDLNDPINNNILSGLPRELSGKESACQCRRPRYDP